MRPPRTRRTLQVTHISRLSFSHPPSFHTSSPSHRFTSNVSGHNSKSLRCANRVYRRSRWNVRPRASTVIKPHPRPTPFRYLSSARRHWNFTWSRNFTLAPLAAPTIDSSLLQSIPREEQIYIYMYMTIEERCRVRRKMISKIVFGSTKLIKLCLR